jgi:hypothetical protein
MSSENIVIGFAVLWQYVFQVVVCVLSAVRRATHFKLCQSCSVELIILAFFFTCFFFTVICEPYFSVI